MATDIFLLILPTTGNPIPGETIQDQYFGGPTFSKGTVIEISEYSFGVENPTTMGTAATGAGAGKAKLDSLEIKKVVDKSSPALLTAIGMGSHFTLQLYVRRAGALGGKPFLAWEFQLATLTDLQWAESEGDEAPEEKVTFVYGALAIGYHAQATDGSLSMPATKSGWSQVANSSQVNDTLILS